MPRFVRNKKIEEEFKESIECGEKDWSLYTEKLLLDVREIIAQQMNKGNISRADLAKLLNCSRSYITQLLNGDTNIKIGTLVKVLFVLGVKPSINYTYENIEILKTFNKNTTVEMEFKESTKTTTTVIENKINQQDYEPA
jgi:transcriptional regulator with XRE-family HTH domain